jgi:predicted TIM-barrel fold metal-dependent hydrolase
VAAVIVDAWLQHPTPRFLAHDMFDSLRRWGALSGEQPPAELPLEMTIAAMDAGGVDFGLLTAWHAPREGALISNDEVAGWVASRPQRLGGLAAVPLDSPMRAVRELRRCIEDLGMLGLRMLPWLWEAPPTDRRFYPLYAACVELGVPFCAQVGHTGPLRPSEPGRPIPYIDQVALDFPELTIVGGHIGYPWTEEMIAVCRKHENVYIDTSAYTSRRLPPELVAYMKTGSGRHKVLFGSNHPMIAPAKALEDLDALELDADTRELYLGANARRVFKLDLRAASARA